MTSGLSLASAETLLTERAADYLAAGPADPQSLISHVCQIPGAPSGVAEHMATALFAGHQRFVRESDGRWSLRDAAAIDALVSRPKTSTRVTCDVAIPTELARESFVVVDVETTGTRPFSDRVTEVAVVQVKDGIATPVFDSLINPERAIPPAIMALTNINWEMVKDAPRFRDVCPQLIGVLEGSVFVAHNASFDWRFIASEIQRATGRKLHGRQLCTVRLARRLLPQLRRRNLDSLCYHYGIDNAARHRAGGDALATAQILLKLLDLARDRGCASVDDVERLLAAGTAKKKRPRRPPA
ncbi:MAG TPA: 3'-5' exonuclease, partial [Gemmatimonadaceae bacterium]